MTAAARKAFEEAQALETSGDLDKALVSYLKAQELSPQDTEIAYRTACALLQAGYLEEAQSQLRRIVFAEPDHLGARASLGNCQLLLGDTANAKQNFVEVLEQAPDNRNALYGFASVLLKEGMAADASVPAKHLVGLLPDSAAALTLFAETQAKTDQSSTAIAAYRKALKIVSNYVPALLGLAEALLRRNRFDEVIDLTVKANQLVPDDPFPLQMLSDALSGKGALDDAFEAGEEALKRNPHSVEVLVRLSILSRKLGKAGAALKHALAAHDLDMTAQGPLNALGAALAAEKFASQARSVLTSLPAGKGLDPEVRRFVDNLIDADKENAETPLSDEPEAIGGKKLSDNVSAAAVPKNDDPEVTSPDLDPEPARANKSAPAVNFLPGAEDQIPNVLGLQRQDKS